MELKFNDLVIGSSGRIGDQLVYRQRGGKTIIAKRPRKKSTPDSPHQLKVRELFTEAVFYAKSVIEDELKKAVYQPKANANKSAYNIALSDFCRAPEIRKYDVSAYTGQAGDQISIRAIDDFKVEWVRVIINDCAGNTIEEGSAVLSGNKVDWIFTASAPNPGLTGTKLIISAADMPGNVTILEVIL